MALLVNPDTGTVVSVKGDLEARYRARGWAEHGSQSASVKAAPEKPKPEPDTDSDDTETEPVKRSQTRRKK